MFAVSLQRSVDLNRHEPRQLTASQRFRHNDFVTGFVTVIWSQREGLGKMALKIVKYFYDRPSQPIGVIWFAISLFAVSCRGPVRQSLLSFILQAYSSDNKHNVHINIAHCSSSQLVFRWLVS